MGFRNMNKRSGEKLTEYVGFDIALQSLEDSIELSDLEMPDGSQQDAEPLRARWLVLTASAGLIDMGETLVFSSVLQTQVQAVYPDWAVGTLRHERQKKDETRSYYTLEALDDETFARFGEAAEQAGIS